MQRIFLDTEFTSFLNSSKLISIGLVAEDGSTFYAELSGWKSSEASEFCHFNVIPLLTKTPQSFSEVGSSLRTWLEERGECMIATDSLTWDWRWLTQLLSTGFPTNMQHQPLLLTMNYLHNFDAFEAALEEYFAKVTPHHALNDAKANRHAWLVSGKDTFLSDWI